MSVLDVLGGVCLALAANECCELSPWAAEKIVRWSARVRYDEQVRAKVRAEELAALIKSRPGQILKLATAMCFAAAALRVRCARAAAMLQEGLGSVSPQGVIAVRRAAVALVSATVVLVALATLSVPDHGFRNPPDALSRSDGPVAILNQVTGDGNTIFLVQGRLWRPASRVTLIVDGRSSPIHPVVDSAGTFNYAINESYELFSGPIPPGYYRVVIKGVRGVRVATYFTVIRPSIANGALVRSGHRNAKSSRCAPVYGMPPPGL